MQISMFEKIIDPLWSKFDTENNGYLTHDQCKLMILEVLKKSGYEKFYVDLVVTKVLE